MTQKTRQQILAEIIAHIRDSGSGYNQWYAGIAADPKARLFTDHNVKEKSWWIHRDAGTDTDARAIEASLHSLGCKGAGGGGDENTVFVYAYQIASTTVE